MKKRAMKKYIPKNTDYCYKTIKVKKDGQEILVKMCKNMINLGVKTYTGIYKGNPYEEKIPTYRCKYTGISSVDDICFSDDCKCCGISTSKF